MHRQDGRHGVDEHQITIYEHDGNGLATKEINAAGGEALYVYDGNGDLTQNTDPDCYVTEYSHNSLDLVREINYNGTKRVGYAYNKVGELVRMDDWNGTTRFEVDLLKRITKTTDTKGRVTQYGYDSESNQTRIRYPDGTVSGYEYDLAGRQTSMLYPDEKCGHRELDLVKNYTGYEYDAVLDLYYAKARIIAKEEGSRISVL